MKKNAKKTFLNAEGTLNIKDDRTGNGQEPPSCPENLQNPLFAVCFNLFKFQIFSFKTLLFNFSYCIINYVKCYIQIRALVSTKPIFDVY